MWISPGIWRSRLRWNKEASFIMRIVRNTLLRSALPLLLTLAIGPATAVVAQEAFHVNKDLYSVTADPAADIAAAQIAARKGHKRILLEFGGNWCGDCQVLD